MTGLSKPRAVDRIKSEPRILRREIGHPGVVDDVCFEPVAIEFGDQVVGQLVQKGTEPCLMEVISKSRGL